MGGFSAGWLALREPADVAARSTRLAQLASEALGSGRVVHALDLGTGAGSNVRYLSRRLTAPQEWLLVDDDETLLGEVARSFPAAVTRQVNLAAELRSAGPGIFDGRSLVTASALLDLVSEPWLRVLASRCREAGAVVLFALTYDGHVQCEPADAGDEAIRALVNEHQRRDKGFGPALGPVAADRAAPCFIEAGYHVERESSPWVLMPHAAELQRELIGGWAHAAIDMAPEQTAFIESWKTRRLAHVEAGRSRVTVGHVDMVGWPERSG